MNTYLFGTTACAWFLHNQYIPSPATGKFARGLVECVPNANTLSCLTPEIPYALNDIHIMVSNKNERRRLDGITIHVVGNDVIDNNLICIGKNLYAPKPAVALLQAAGQIDKISLIDLTSKMCSTFFISNWDAMGLGARQPILAKRDILNFCNAQKGQNHKNLLRAALPYVCERAASPKEIELFLKLTLPARLGGMGLPQPKLNSKIELWEKTKKLADSSFYVADAHWSDAKVVLEYDSDSAHLTSEQKNHDEIKRRVLEAQGYKVFTITRKQLNSPVQIQNAATLIAKALGKRARPRAANFAQSRGELFRRYVQETRTRLEQEPANQTDSIIF